jgi:hypothetical protein
MQTPRLVADGRRTAERLAALRIEPLCLEIPVSFCVSRRAPPRRSRDRERCYACWSGEGIRHERRPGGRPGRSRRRFGGLPMLTTFKTRGYPRQMGSWPGVVPAASSFFRIEVSGA